MYERLKELGVEKVSMRGYDKDIREEIAEIITKDFEAINELFNLENLYPKMDGLIVENKKAKNTAQYYLRTSGQNHKLHIKLVADYERDAKDAKYIPFEGLLAYHLEYVLTKFYIGRKESFFFVRIHQIYKDKKVDERLRKLVEFVQKTDEKIETTKAFAVLFTNYLRYKKGRLDFKDEYGYDLHISVEKVKEFGELLEEALKPIREKGEDKHE